MMHLLCYADTNMTISQKKCYESAWDNGCRELWFYDIDKLKHVDPGFYATNKIILDQERGCGYWLWKPWLINYIMNAPITNQGDFIFYSDSGVEIINNLKYIEDQMQEDIFLFSGRFKHVEWAKMDVIKYINHASLSYTDTHNGPMYSMNGYESFPQVQASNMFFRNTQKARDFVKEWLLLCQMPGFIDDSPSQEPNYQSFAEHRHDQAILTCLQIKHNIKLHWFPSTTNMDRKQDFPNDSYPALFNHHRKRNNEW